MKIQEETLFQEIRSVRPTNRINASGKTGGPTEVFEEPSLSGPRPRLGGAEGKLQTQWWEGESQPIIAPVGGKERLVTTTSLAKCPLGHFRIIQREREREEKGKRKEN